MATTVLGLIRCLGTRNGIHVNDAIAVPLIGDHGGRRRPPVYADYRLHVSPSTQALPAEDSGPRYEELKDIEEENAFRF